MPVVPTHHCNQVQFPHEFMGPHTLNSVQKVPKSKLLTGAHVRGCFASAGVTARLEVTFPTHRITTSHPHHAISPAFNEPIHRSDALRTSTDMRAMPRVGPISQWVIWLGSCVESVSLARADTIARLRPPANDKRQSLWPRHPVTDGWSRLRNGVRRMGGDQKYGHVRPSRERPPGHCVVDPTVAPPYWALLFSVTWMGRVICVSAVVVGSRLFKAPRLLSLSIYTTREKKKNLAPEKKTKG